MHRIYICFSFLLSYLVAVQKLHLFFYANLDSVVVSLSHSAFVPTGLGSFFNLLLAFVLAVVQFCLGKHKAVLVLHHL